MQQLNDDILRLLFLSLSRNQLEIRLDVDLEQVHTPKGRYVMCTQALPQPVLPEVRSPAAQPPLPWHVELTGLPVSMLGLDANGLILLANRAACMLLGCTQYELAGKPLLQMLDPPELENRAGEPGDSDGRPSASLACLTRYPIVHIKIARSLIGNRSGSPASAAMVEAIIGVAYSFRIRVGKVGVGNRLQQSFLQEHGWPFAQGSYPGDAVAPLEASGVADKAMKLLLDA